MVQTELLGHHIQLLVFCVNQMTLNLSKVNGEISRRC